MINKKIARKDKALPVFIVCSSGCSSAKIQQIYALSQGAPKEVGGATQMFCDEKPQPETTASIAFQK